MVIAALGGTAGSGIQEMAVNRQVVDSKEGDKEVDREVSAGKEESAGEETATFDILTVELLTNKMITMNETSSRSSNKTTWVSQSLNNIM